MKKKNENQSRHNAPGRAFPIRIGAVGFLAVLFTGALAFGNDQAPTASSCLNQAQALYDKLVSDEAEIKDRVRMQTALASAYGRTGRTAQAEKSLAELGKMLDSEEWKNEEFGTSSIEAAAVSAWVHCGKKTEAERRCRTLIKKGLELVHSPALIHALTASGESKLMRMVLNNHINAERLLLLQIHEQLLLHQHEAAASNTEVLVDTAYAMQAAAELAITAKADGKTDLAQTWLERAKGQVPILQKEIAAKKEKKEVDDDQVKALCLTATAAHLHGDSATAGRLLKEAQEAQALVAQINQKDAAAAIACALIRTGAVDAGMALVPLIQKALSSDELTQTVITALFAVKRSDLAEGLYKSGFMGTNLPAFVTQALQQGKPGKAVQLTLKESNDEVRLEELCRIAVALHKSAGQK